MKDLKSVLGLLKKADVVLILFFSVTAIGFNFALTAAQKTAQAATTNAVMTVTVDNAEYMRADLSKDDTYTIQIGDELNVVEVANGTAKMIDANCRDHYCMNQKPIQYSSEIIVCLPHRLLVEIENGAAPVASPGSGEIIPDVVPY